ncbi:winged helix-turn-helix domain-containing protein [Pseudoalteromonas sp. SS15]|uniref:winged helix-turn-helix domain-containing protein n=1 Tax=Pseudoalteromonas sp. SS15 TaxID=3139393 RepID=UPI003BAACF1E
MESFSSEQMKYQFDDFELCLDSETLRRFGKRLNIEPQQFTLLLLLLEQRGEIVERDVIQQRVWVGRPVTDESIRAAVKKLRDLLGDDARTPKFIKTVPKQGYKWLLPVQVIRSNTATEHKPATKSLISILLALLVVVSLMMWFVQTESAVVKPTQLSVSNITELSGSEVFADYHSDTQRLVFLHRETKSSPQQIYIKDLTSNSLNRLTWDTQNYTNVYWSPDGTKLVYGAGNGIGYLHYIAEFDKLGDVIKTQTLNDKSLKNLFVIGWLKAQSGLLFAEQVKSTKQHSIYQYDLESKQLKTLSYPNVAGKGDYLARLSDDGAKLAILREVSKQKAALIIIDLKLGDEEANVMLPFAASKLVWYESTEIFLSSFNGQLAHYNLLSKKIEQDITLPANTHDVFASCGEHCLILRQHNGDFLDIKERPLQVTVEHNALFNGRIFNYAGAQDFPSYLNASADLVFAALNNKQFSIERINSHGKRFTLAEFNGANTLNALVASDDGNQLAGIISGRLFILNTQEAKTTQSLNFVTAALERVENPIWSADNRSIYVAHLKGNVPNIVKLNVFNGEREFVASGFLSFKPLDTDNAIGVDTSLTAWFLKKGEQGWQKQSKLAQLSSASPNRWRIKNNLLYFSRRVAREGEVCFVSLSSPFQDAVCEKMDDNQFRLNFDIHPKQQALLMVESLSAQSNIVRLTW